MLKSTLGLGCSPNGAAWHVYLIAPPALGHAGAPTASQSVQIVQTRIPRDALDGANPFPSTLAYSSCVFPLPPSPLRLEKTARAMGRKTNVTVKLRRRRDEIVPLPQWDVWPLCASQRAARHAAVLQGQHNTCSRKKVVCRCAKYYAK